VSGVGDLLVEKHNDTVPITPTNELSSTGCAYPVTLENHPELVQRSSPFADQPGRAVVVRFSVELDLAGEKVR
jgi:hypothetical protein